ncbi:peptidoglycan-binding protein [Henriciella sp. AS95]|uniref:peptidoglycan-binding protein n=1 Tax=Henriciella sp. AS95 TaxID=3135782 RepID=UPI00316D8EFF
MSNYGPWSVKGIDQRARDAARDAAREEGLTIGEYINRMLLEVGEEDTPSARDRGTPRYPRAVETSDHREDDQGPSRGAFDRLIARLEAVEARSTLALTGIDQSLVGLVTRLNRTDAKTDDVVENVESTLQDLRETYDALQTKIKTIEEDDRSDRNLETLKSLEQAVGQLASHIYDENTRRQDETASVRARVETGIEDLNDRVAGVETKIDSTLSEAAQKVERKVEQAELRAEGTAKHLSERFSELETGVSSRLARIDQFNDRIGAVEGDVAGALSSIESVMTRMQERLHRAETMTNSAMTTLEQTFENLDKRIETIAEQASPEKAAELRQQFESRFDGLAEELRSTIEGTRQELAREIEQAAAAGASPDALKSIEDSIGSLDKRVTTGEERSSRALESMTEQMGRISSAFDARIRDVEARDASEAVTEVRRDVEALSNEVSQRLEDFSQHNDDVIDRITGQMKSLADQFDQRVDDSETRSASAIEQVGEQVASVAQRLQARQDKAFTELKQTLESARKQQDMRLSDALTGVSDRIEQMQSQQSSALSPVQKAIASLATRLESLEDFTTPPHAEKPAAQSYDFEEPAAAPEPTPPPAPSFDAEDEASDWLTEEVDFDPDEPEVGDLEELTAALDAAPAEEPKPEDDDDEFLAGLPELDDLDDLIEDEASPPMDEAFPAMDDDVFADEPAPFEAAQESEEDDPLSALVDWDDGRDETRDSDIFGEEHDFDLSDADGETSEAFAEAALPTQTGEQDEAEFQVALDEEDEPLDYLSRARQAAMAANESSSRRNGRNSAAAIAPAKKKSNKVPLIAAVSVVALATATAGTLITLRGLQNDPGKPTVATQGMTVAPAETAVEEPVADDIAPVEAPLSEADAAAVEDELFDDAAEAVPVGMTEPSPPLVEPETETAAVAPVEETPVAEPEPEPEPQIDFAALPTIPDTPTLESAAADGNAVAQLILGEQRLEAGDYTGGPTLVRRAAEDGQPAAQYRLAKLHEKGLGVPRDLAMARQWTERAAEGGNVKAMHDLAVYYAEGDGGSQSYAAAAEWFRKAADYGLTDSQYNLAVLYEAGLGISPSKSEALYWYEVAARQGDEGAPDKIEELRSILSLEVAQQAQRRAAAWSPAEPEALANGRFTSQAWQVSSVEQVSAIQTVLAALGYQPGPADGIMGAGTIAAITNYKAENGLEADGTITPQLVKSLNDTVEASIQS